MLAAFALKLCIPPDAGQDWAQTNWGDRLRLRDAMLSGRETPAAAGVGGVDFNPGIRMFSVKLGVWLSRPELPDDRLYSGETPRCIIA